SSSWARLSGCGSLPWLRGRAATAPSPPIVFRRHQLLTDRRRVALRTGRVSPRRAPTPTQTIDDDDGVVDGGDGALPGKSGKRGASPANCPSRSPSGLEGAAAGC